MFDVIEKCLSEEQRIEFHSLDNPAKIQNYLNLIPYNTKDTNYCPLRVLQERTAHCYEGALFAASALRRIGYSPILVDMLPEPGTDDDHLIAVYKRHGHYGSIAKSNYWCLRYRDAVYRSVRELVMSYFELYFSIRGEKSMRTYTIPLNLATLDRLDWMCSDRGAEEVYETILRRRKIPVVTAQMIAELSLLDSLSYQAGMLGVDPEGLFKPKPK